MPHQTLFQSLSCRAKLLAQTFLLLIAQGREAARNFNIVRQINERGITVFLVEQNVRQTLAISNWGYVLAKGRVAASGTPTALMEQEDVREAYFGRADATTSARHRD